MSLLALLGSRRHIGCGKLTAPSSHGPTHPLRKTTGALKIIHDKFNKNLALLDGYKVWKGDVWKEERYGYGGRIHGGKVRRYGINDFEKNEWNPNIIVV